MTMHKYTRHGTTIKTIGDDGAVHKEKFEFINEAKRRSRELQLATDKALGRGSLRVQRP